MMVRLCKDWLNWMIKNDEDATKRSMAKEYLNLMDELEQAYARIDALVRDKDELAGRIMRMEELLKRIKEALQYCKISACKPAQGVAETCIEAIDALLGGKEDV